MLLSSAPYREQFVRQSWYANYPCEIRSVADSEFCFITFDLPMPRFCIASGDPFFLLAARIVSQDMEATFLCR